MQLSINLDDRGSYDSTIKSPELDINNNNNNNNAKAKLSNNTILSYISSDPNLFDTITYKPGKLLPDSPTKSDPKNAAQEVAGETIDVNAKFINATLRTNLSVENFHRLLDIVEQFARESAKAASTGSSIQTGSGINLPPGMNSLGTSSGGYNLAMSGYGYPPLGASSNLGMSMGMMNSINIGSSIFGRPGLQQTGGFSDSMFLNQANLMDSAIFGSAEESRLEKSILTKYLTSLFNPYSLIRYRFSPLSSWTPSLSSQKMLLRLEIRSGDCNLVAPTDNGNYITTSISFGGLVLRTKKLRIMHSLELRFQRFCISAGNNSGSKYLLWLTFRSDDETSAKPVLECQSAGIRSSKNESCFKATISMAKNEENNDSSVTIDLQTRPIYFLLDMAWLESVTKFAPPPSTEYVNCACYF